MNINTFINRPILSIVISVAIILVGLIGLSQLPLEQFPDIAPPTVRVSATYTGANAETVMKSVITPLEEQMNGVENMMYMTSTATNTGSASISVYFKQGTDPDMSVVNVQNRVASAQGLLPAEVTKSGITVRKRQNNSLKSMSLYSPDDSFDSNFLTNYMKINIEPRMSRIAGVGDVNIWGASYAMRIWLDPQKMAQYSLMPSDITAVLAEQNVESPAGTLGAESGNTFRYVLKYRGRYEYEEEYGNLVIKSLPDGSVLRLKDVATIELGAENYSMYSQTIGHPGANCMIAQTSGSNANEIINEIDKVAEDVSKSLPEGMVLTDITSTKDFLDASVKNVILTLVLAVILVVLVVYFFLHDLKATIIPTIAIVVSVIGTFAFLAVAGFSLNLLTLFALVLVIGTVVDNSIVVVEAVQAKFEEGITDPYRATVEAMKGLSLALVTSTFVFMAVFIPVSFMGGTTGTFYKQFGLTMAVAVAISLVNALTLSPALCALILKPSDKKNSKGSSRNGLQSHYASGVAKMLRHKVLAGGLIAAAAVLLVLLMNSTKTGLVPQEDMGVININVQTAPGSNIEETQRIMDEIESLIRDIPQIKIYSRVTGKDAIHNQSASAGSFSIRLKDWKERRGKGDDINSVIKEIYRRTDGIKAASIRISTTPMISGYGMSNGFELYVQDKKGGSVEDLLQTTRDFIKALNSRPEISRAYTTFDTKYPQYMVEVDAALCKKNGVSPADVLSTLSGYVGGSYSSNLNRFTKLYRVMVQAAPESRLDTESLNKMFVRNSSGQMTPLSQYLTLTRVYGSESLSRFNLFTSITVMGVPADGYSSGQAIKAIKEVAGESLPEGYGYEFGGMSREEASTGNTTTRVFIICILFIFLILCALYESVMIPFAIILAVPFGLLGSFLFAKLWGLENNIYMQTGLIMLIGLLAKTAILLTEYATERRREGMSLSAAAMSAAKARLRPILMTSLTMVFGMLPMMFSRGVGAHGNVSVGVVTVGGMLVGTIGLLFVVPVLFIIFQYLQEKLMPKRSAPVLTALVLLFTLSGCGICGKYEAADKEAAAGNLLRESGTESDSASIAGLDWKELFTDPCLQALIDTGLARNTDLQTAKLQVEEAAASLYKARMNYLPALSLFAEGGLRSAEGSEATYSYEFGLDASWDPVTFGRKANAKRSSAAALAEAAAFEQAVRTRLIATIAESYCTLLMLDEQLAISRRTKENWDETVSTLEALVLAGQSREVAVHQARASRAAIEAAALTIEKSIFETENSLCALLRKNSTEIPRLSLSEQEFPQELNVGLPVAILSGRPDVRQAEAALAKAFYGLNGAKADLYPSLSLSGSIGWTSEGGLKVSNPGKIIESLLGSLVEPLLSGGSRRAEVKIAEAKLKEAELAFEQAVLTAGNEVNDALKDAQTAEGKIILDCRQVDELNEAVTKTWYLVRYSDANYLELLNAKQSLFNAELTLAQDRTERLLSVIRLYCALGGGSLQSPASTGEKQ